jgi:glycosyltransferase involved in cell wall biosynthesis
MNSSWFAGAGQSRLGKAQIAPTADKQLSVLVAHAGRQHSHQAALALEEAGLLGCYATGVPISRNQLDASWSRLIQRLSVYDEVDIPISRARLNLVAPAANRVLSRYMPEIIAGPIQYEAYRIFDRWVARLICQQSFDVVISYENCAFYTFQAAKRTGAKCILDAASLHHADQQRLYRSGLPSRYKARVDRLKDAEIALADCIFVASDFAFKSYIANMGTSKNIKIIPLGVDVNLFSPPQERRINQAAPLNFIFVGSGTTQKGFDVVLDSMSKLVSEGLSLRLLVAGITDKQLIMRKKHLIDKIVEFGMISQIKLPSIMRQADCLLLPSRFDSFGMVVAEALSCGVPVIVSDMVGAKQLVEEGRNGFVVPVGSTDALAAKMRWCISNRKRLKGMSSLARAAAEQVRWERYRERIIEAIREVLRDQSLVTDCVSYM